jgi:molybdopterin-guanine dinucleotide biosynthesis protein MobB
LIAPTQHRKTPVLIFVVGSSGSGKTTTIEYLTAHLNQLGFRVGIVKHIHSGGLNLDTRGKDTWRHARTGARVVVGVAPRELLLLKKTSMESKFDDVLNRLRSESLDVVLFEGFSAISPRHSYRIVTACNKLDLKRTLSKTQPPVLAVTGPVARSSKSTLRTYALPSEGHALVAAIRQLIRPAELKDTLRRAEVEHGGVCVGLAVGLRASYLASNIVGDLSSGQSVFGTKRCIADAVTHMYPKLSVRERNETS